MIRHYKGHTVDLAPVGVAGYTIDGKQTYRGGKPRPNARAAWKAAKAEINGMRNTPEAWLDEA